MNFQSENMDLHNYSNIQLRKNLKYFEQHLVYILRFFNKWYGERNWLQGSFKETIIPTFSDIFVHVFLQHSGVSLIPKFQM